MSVLMQKYTVKSSSIVDIRLYLGANIGIEDYGNVSYAWTMTFYPHVKEAIRNLKKRIKDKKMEFNKKLSDINYSPKNICSAVEY